jgi:cation diffusion facilitator CzcD-associated flavoprotein CzcO
MNYLFTAENLAKKDMKRDIPDSGLRDKLIPEYRIGCKRITPSNTYFKSLADSKVEVIRSDITSVKEKTITTSDGREYSVDVS